MLDKDLLSSQPIGWCDIDCLGLVEGEKIVGWHELQGEGAQGSIKLELQFFTRGSLEEDSSKILPSYFPSRENNRVTLYQDADTPPLQIFKVG